MSQNIIYKHLEEIRDYIFSKTTVRPKIALILGTSLGSIAEELEDKVVLPYQEVPFMPLSTAPGHEGEFVFGFLDGVPLLVMSGRFHYYEGYSFEELAQPVRILKILGIDTLILTNAAGCVNTAWQVGDIMVIEDHINLVGASPMRGENVDELGERFFDISNMYTFELQELALETADQLGQDERIRNGVYFYMPGPHLESPAEIRAIRVLGGDAVGMSTVTEALTAAHCGIKVLGLSVLTNMAAGIEEGKLGSGEVSKVAESASHRLLPLIKGIVEKLA